MPLQRITTGAGERVAQGDTNLASEAIRLPAGESALNRQTTGPTALIVAEGAVAIGTLDDHATLSAGEGVLLEADAPYSLVAESDSLTLVFSMAPTQSGQAG